MLWYKDAEPLIGEIDCEYVVDEVTEKDVGLYYCLVTHPDNEQIQRQSKMAKLTIRKREEGTFSLYYSCSFMLKQYSLWLVSPSGLYTCFASVIFH